MYRGTTPEIRIHIPEKVDLSQMKDVWVTVKNFYNQITKKLSDGSVILNPGAHTVTITFSQEETLSLSEGYADIQVRFLTNSDQALATKKMRTTVNDILESGVMS